MFLDAYASARPKIIQFTTISGMYTPKDLFKDGMYACNNNWINVTKDATITMNAGIRTLSGITLRSSEINTLDNTSTAVVVSPMPNPLMADVVTARVGHIPNIITNVGFSVMIPFFNRSTHVFMGTLLF